MHLECRNIQFYYPGSAKPILEDLSMVLEEPGLHGLFGPSGVGKTSLAKILAGMYRPSIACCGSFKLSVGITA